MWSSHQGRNSRQDAVDDERHSIILSAIGELRVSTAQGPYAMTSCRRSGTVMRRPCNSLEALSIGQTRQPTPVVVVPGSLGQTYVMKWNRSMAPTAKPSAAHAAVFSPFAIPTTATKIAIGPMMSGRKIDSPAKVLENAANPGQSSCDRSCRVPVFGCGCESSTGRGYPPGELLKRSAPPIIQTTASPMCLWATSHGRRLEAVGRGSVLRV